MKPPTPPPASPARAKTWHQDETESATKHMALIQKLAEKVFREKDRFMKERAALLGAFEQKMITDQLAELKRLKFHLRFLYTMLVPSAQPKKLFPPW